MTCSIIGDLLPLYIDGCCSEESADLVKGHLQTCAACRRALAAIEALDNGRGERAKELKRREKADYKRFFKVANKRIVIYSEKSGFYKYFEALMKELFALSNVTVHYVTNDPDDVIFGLAESNPRLRAYYIGNKKLITLMAAK